MKVSEIRALFAGVTSNYDTHRPALCEALLRVGGPIVELGMGEGSTRALHSLSEACGRLVSSFDNDVAWAARYASLRSGRHKVEQVASWDDCPIEATAWGVALVDHAPAQRRVVDIRRLAHNAQVVVVHDTEDPTYGYEEVFGEFAYRLDYRAQASWTTIVSNFVDVSGWTISA